jgi:hypothetical protein
MHGRNVCMLRCHRYSTQRATEQARANRTHLLETLEVPKGDGRQEVLAAFFHCEHCRCSTRAAWANGLLLPAFRSGSVMVAKACMDAISTAKIRLDRALLHRLWLALLEGTSASRWKRLIRHNKLDLSEQVAASFGSCNHTLKQGQPGRCCRDPLQTTL